MMGCKNMAISPMVQVCYIPQSKLFTIGHRNPVFWEGGRAILLSSVVLSPCRGFMLYKPAWIWVMRYWTYCVIFYHYIAWLHCLKDAKMGVIFPKWVCSKVFAHTLCVIIVFPWIPPTDTIIESVDCISRNGPDMPIYVIYNKNSKSSVQLQFQDV